MQQMTRRKKCKKCGFPYKGDDIEIAFRFLEKRRGAPRHMNICKLCEQDERTGKARKDRWLVKARNARRTHAKRLDISVKDLELKHGWDIKQMAKDVAFHYQNGCPECHELFAEMPNGLSDITLDIWDKRVEPDYDANSRWMCSTCNKAKGDIPPEKWAAYKRLWRERDAFFIEQSILPQPEQYNFLSREWERK